MSTRTRTSPYLHARVIASSTEAGTVVSCSHAECGWTATVVRDEHGAARAFAAFNGHLASLVVAA